MDSTPSEIDLAMNSIKEQLWLDMINSMANDNDENLKTIEATEIIA